MIESFILNIFQYWWSVDIVTEHIIDSWTLSVLTTILIVWIEIYWESVNFTYKDPDSNYSRFCSQRSFCHKLKAAINNM